MPNRPIREDSARTIALALAAWGAAVAWAALDGVFARLDAPVAVALAAFAAAYAAGTYALDPGVRAFVHRASRAQLIFAAALADGLLLVVAAVALAHAHPLAALGHFPLALVAYFGMPLAGVAHLAALAAPAPAPPRLRSSPARSPGATPAAP
jgi:hypothetical protein